MVRRLYLKITKYIVEDNSLIVQLEGNMSNKLLHIRWYKHLRCVLFVLAASLAFARCVSDVPHIPGNTGEDVHVSMDMATRPGTINTNPEDRVKSVRVLVFDSSTGAVVANQLLPTFIQASLVWQDPIKITSGIRDFFFVANETTADWDVSAALQSVTHREQLFVEPALARLLYKPDFKPTDEAGNRAFLMTALYRNIDIALSKLGTGTQVDPYHFLSDASGDHKVELIRTLSKLSVTIKNSVYRNSTGKDELLFNDLVFEKVMLKSIPKYFSLFNTQLFYQPYNAGGWNFFTANLYSPITDNYYMGDVTTEGLVIEGDAYDLKRNEVPYPVDPSTLPSIGGMRVRDYQTTLYVPEYLRQSNATTETTAGLGLADAMSFEITFKPEWGAPTQVTRYSIDHVEFNRPDDGYHLINPGNYSRYSVLRNTSYSLTAKEREYFIVDFNVTNWTQVKTSTLMGYGYNVTVDADGKVTVSNTVAACAPHVIKLVAMSPASFSDDTTEKTLLDTEAANLLAGEIASYQLKNLPGAGNYLQVYYNNVLIKTFTK